jgi:hypothetical protein
MFWPLMITEWKAKRAEAHIQDGWDIEMVRSDVTLFGRWLLQEPLIAAFVPA